MRGKCDLGNVIVVGAKQTGFKKSNVFCKSGLLFLHNHNHPVSSSFVSGKVLLMKEIRDE